jgi:hypothetical protein
MTQKKKRKKWNENVIHTIFFFLVTWMYHDLFFLNTHKASFWNHEDKEKEGGFIPTSISIYSWQAQNMSHQKYWISTYCHTSAINIITKTNNINNKRQKTKDKWQKTKDKRQKTKDKRQRLPNYLTT